MLHNIFYLFLNMLSWRCHYSGWWA